MSADLIIAAIQLGIQLIGYGTKAAQTLKQNKELTPEEERKLDQAIEAIGTAPWDQDTGK